MPRAFRIPCAVLFAALLLPAVFIRVGAAAQFDHAELARQALEHHIRPSYQHLASAAGEFGDVVSQVCDLSPGQGRTKLEAALDALIVAWGRIEHIAFGPITRGERLERIMFWPDRRGIGARQVTQALTARDPSVVDARRLAEKSAAMQGLPALELLLFPGSEAAGEDPEARRHRCAFASAVATNVANIARLIVAEWSDPRGYSLSWLAPGPDNAHFLNPIETTLALAKAFDQGLERVRDQRLGGPLGLNAQRRRLPAVLGRSGRTMLLVSANIEGLRDLYEMGGLARSIASTADANDTSSMSSLVSQVAAELQTANARVASLIGVPTPFEGSQNAQRVIALGFPLKNARVTAATLLTTAANLPLGFNASDGD